MIFAELDENKKVKAILNTWKKPETGIFVEIPSYDTSILGASYDEKTKSFIPEEKPVEETQEDLLSIVKRIEADLAAVKTDVTSLKTAKTTTL